jgi:formyltetrahydrofolate hydrolase
MVLVGKRDDADDAIILLSTKGSHCLLLLLARKPFGALCHGIQWAGVPTWLTVAYDTNHMPP